MEGNDYGNREGGRSSSRQKNAVEIILAGLTSVKKSWLVIGICVPFLLFFLYESVAVNVSRDHVAYVFAKFGKTAPEGRIIVEEGYKGYWREPLNQGMHWFLMFQRLWNYSITEVPMLIIEKDQIGLVEAMDGEPLEPGQILARDDSTEIVDGKEVFHMGQKGTRDKVLTPGKYGINPKYQVVTALPAVIIPAGKVGIVERLTGVQPPPGTILVSEKSDYRGIQREVLTNGTYFLNPKKVHVDIILATIIDKGQIGIVTKKVGKIPPTGTILVKADDEFQGIQEEVLQPGMYYVNPYERDVKIVPAVNVPDGNVGIIIAKTGKPKPDNRILAEPGERGIQREPIPPGLYYMNPYQFDVVIFDCRQQKYEMTAVADQGDTPGDDSITFLSNDGFVLKIDLTVIYQVLAQDAPYIVAMIGRDVKSVRDIEIRPSARNYSRIYGSMRNGEDFVHGKTREEFQSSLEKAMKDRAANNKIQILQAQVQHFEVPQDLRDPITRKVIAVKVQQQYEQEQATQQAKADLARKQEWVNFEQKKVIAETEKVQAETKAAQGREVEKINMEMKKFQAEGDGNQKRINADAELYRQQKEAEGNLAQKTAEAEGQKKMVDAWGGAGGERLVAFELAKVMKGAAILPLETFFGGGGSGKGGDGNGPIRYHNTIDMLNYFGINKLIDQQANAPKK